LHSLQRIISQNSGILSITARILTVEAVVVVVVVAIITLLTELGVHNTITTPAYLYPCKYNRPTRAASPSKIAGQLSLPSLRGK